MRTAIAWFAAVSLLAAAGCSKKEESGADEEGGEGAAKPVESDEGGGDDGKGEKLFDYPPKGDGPHQGYDLGALRDKLQGTWMVGSTAFNSVPQVWHVKGDEVVVYDTKGEKSENTLQLLAPCYAKVGAKGGGSATYVHFVFDGDTLYQGLGNSGLTDGDKTIGCMSAGVFILEGDECTMWKKKSFAKEGEMWEKDPGGECGMEGDAFYADDTGSKRKIYGVQKLEVKVGNALMTKQMEGNKTTKMASLDEALAKQKEALDKKEALTKVPEDLPFADWKLPDNELTLEKNQRVWAAGISRKGTWRLAGLRWKETTDGVVWLKGMTDRFAPPAFVHVPTEAAKKGDAVAYIAGRTLYGYVKSVDGDELTMSYLSGSKVKDKTAKADKFLKFDKGSFQLGTPVLFKEGEEWSNGRAVVADGEQVYVLHGRSDDSKVEPMTKSDLVLLDGSTKLRRGAKVLVKQSSGMGSLRWLPGKVTKVHGGGAAYEVKTDDGKKYTQMWAYVTKKP